MDGWIWEKLFPIVKSVWVHPLENNAYLCLKIA